MGPRLTIAIQRWAYGHITTGARRSDSKNTASHLERAAIDAEAFAEHRPEPPPGRAPSFPR